MPVDAARAKSLFLAASDLDDPVERAAYLDRECGDDSELRARVVALLRANDASPLPASASDVATGVHDSHAPVPTEDHGDPTARVGSVVAGKYKLIEEIGDGGMGSVYMAQQTEPVKRAVAVKVIKAGMDSKAVLVRFEAERQALAIMDHPNIARVLDAGTTDGGRPFFVMELVKGTPITQFCDERKLTPRQRLELFVPVCQAIQHAHQKGVIHRDIKPSNVLVALYDDKPIPKVIDFGVAKAAGQTLTDKTLMTGFGAVVGTPEYMSPEQANLNNLDIDTRSDVYSLGVLLYELLTGTTPVDRKSLGKAALLEVLRIVREVEAPRPSAKLSTIDTLPSVAANRGTVPAKLSKLMKGELDWLVLKALEKDRTRRYETANGLARDIQRYLADELVEARPPSAGYRLKKFVRRHKGQVIAASLVLIALLAGIAGTTFGLFRAETRRVEAEEARDNEAEQRRAAETAAAAEKAANELTRRRMAQIEKGVELFAGLVRGLNPRAEEQGAPPLYEQLRQRAATAADALVGETVGDPEAVARLQTLLGDTLRELGDHAKAVEVLERARATREANLGTDHLDTLATLNNLALAYQAAGKLPEAIALYEQVRHVTVKKLGVDHPDTPTTLGNLGGAYLAARRLPEAIALLEQARDAQVRMLGADHSQTLTTLNNLALGYQSVGKLPEAIALHKQIRDVRVKKLGADHADTLTTLNNLAVAYQSAGKQPEAVAVFEQVRDARVRKLGVDHPDTLATLGNLAVAYQSVGKLPEAIALLEQLKDSQVKKLGADHADTLARLNNLAGVYWNAGKMPEAIALLEQVRDVRVRKLGVDHPQTLNTLNNLAVVYQAARKLPEAIALLEQVRDARVRKLGADHPDTLTTLNNLAAAYQAAGKLPEAIALYEQVRDGRIKKLGADHPDTLTTLNNLASAYRDADRLPEAIALFEQVKGARVRKLGPDHPATLGTLGNLAAAYQAAGKLPEAIALFEQAAAGTEKRRFQFGHAGGIIAKTIGAYEQAKQLDKAEAWRRKWLAVVKEQAGADSPAYADELAGLGSNLLDQKKWTEAETALKECLALREKTQPDAWTTFNTQSLLGGALRGQKKYADAQPLLRKGYEGMKAREKSIPKTGGAELRIPEALDRLIELYTATNKPDEVKKWQAERAKYPEVGPMPREKK